MQRIGDALGVKFFFIIYYFIIYYFFIISDKKECTLLANPCNGNGRCIELAGSYRCDCDQGWYGPFCQNGKFHRSCVQTS